MALNGTPNTFFAGTEWCGCPCDARRAVGRCPGAELNAVGFFVQVPNIILLTMSQTKIIMIASCLC